MATLFPFGFPPATVCYLAYYVFVLVVHVVFMHYVLAGSACLAVGGLLGRRVAVASPSGVRSPRIYDLLRDWMPFMLGAAITAGVAPLLFLQVLYQKAFYTANLLLFHRWMAIVPALMVGFYLLYVLKSDRGMRWPAAARALVGLGVCACFAFTGWSWTENHLLSLDQASWVEQYASGRWIYRNAELTPRLVLWAVGAVPTMSVILGWQLRHAERGGATDVVAPRWFALLPLMGLALIGLAGGAYFSALGDDVRAALRGPLGAAYLYAGIAGWGVQVVAWIGQALRARYAFAWLAAATGGCLLTVVCVCILREVRRLVAIDVAALTGMHADAAEVGGLTLFLAFFAINAVAITGCVLIVRRGLPRQ